MMRLRGAFGYLLIVAVVLTGQAHGQEVSTDNGSAAIASVGNEAQPQPEKEALAESILDREETRSGRAFDPGFRAVTKEALASGKLTPSDFGLGANLAGTGRTDLVYTPITPCRIIDTRLAGGPIAAGATRSFVVAGATGFPGQGGTSGGCGVPRGAATAAVVNFVAVNATAPGDVRITPFGTPMPLASIINYAGGVRGLNLANGLAVALCNLHSATCTFDITLQADASPIDIVADVQGYFRQSFELPTRIASSTTTVLTAPCNAGGSFAYTAPKAGKLLVRLDMTLRFAHANGTYSEAGARLGTTAADCLSSGGGQGNLFVHLPEALPSGTYYFTQPIARVYDVVAGSNTIFVNAFRSSGEVAIHTWAADATFTPN